jgi:hypothetical protein
MRKPLVLFLFLCQFGCTYDWSKNIDPSLLAVLGTLGGALIGSMSTIFGNWLTKRHELKKHRESLVFQNALEEWKAGLDFSTKVKGVTVKLHPVITYVDFYWRLMRLIEKGNLTDQKMEEFLQESMKIRAIVEKFDKQLRKQPTENT